jgi:hypothetical protein
LNVNGTGSGTGGTVSLIANSATPFVYDSTTATNGTLSTITAVGGTISLTNLGGAVVNIGALNSAANINLTSGGAGNVAIEAQILATNEVTLNAAGTGNVTYATPTTGFGVNAPTITFSAAGGQIGTTNGAAIAPLAVNASNLIFGSTLKAVSVQDTRTSALTINTENGATFGSSFRFAGAGQTTLTSALNTAGFVSLLEGFGVTNGFNVDGNISTTSGAIQVIGAGGQVTVGANQVLNAGNALLTIENSAAAGSTISIGADAQLSTSGNGGNVSIVLGAVPTAPVAGPVPANVTVNHKTGGSAFFGNNGINVTATPLSPVVINLEGANVIFNTGAQSASAITVGAGVTITADPVNVSGLAPTPLSAQPAVTHAAVADAIGAALNSTATAPVANAVQAASTNAVPAATTSPNAASSSPLSFVTTGSTASTGSAQSVANPLPILASPQAITSGAVSVTTPAAVAPQTASLAGVFSNTAVGAAALNALHAIETSWMSDTELVTGKVPAILQSDEDFGITPESSTVVELDEVTPAAFGGKDTSEKVNELISNALANRGKAPLTGGVTKSVGAGKTMNLKRGSVVFAPTYDTYVNTEFGKVKVSAKSVVLMMAFQHGLAVFNIDDQKARAVTIDTGTKQMGIAPGTQMLITHDSVRNFADINPAQLFGYRNVRDRQLGGGLKAFESEFSVQQAISIVQPLKQMLNSEHPHAKKVTNHMLKTAAILNQMAGSNYEQVMRPGITAYNNH